MNVREWLLRRLGAPEPEPFIPRLPTYRTLTVCFSDRTVEIDGRRIGPVESNCLALPILSDYAVYMPSYERLSPAAGATPAKAG